MDSSSSIREECIQAFHHADEHKGFLTPEDYKVAVLELLGYKPSKYEINTVWKTHVEHTQGTTTLPSDQCDEESKKYPGMDQSTFVSLMTERLKNRDQDELIRQIFVSFDVHLRGFITTSDCKQAFKQVVPHIHEELIEGWFREVDADGDGRVTFRDFELMMKSYQYLSTHATS